MPPKVTDTRPSNEAIHKVEEETAAAARRIVASYAENKLDGVTLMSMLGVEPEGLIYAKIAEEEKEPEEAPKKTRKTTKKATKSTAKKTTKKATKATAAKKTTKKATKATKTTKTTAAKKTTKKATKQA